MVQLPAGHSICFKPFQAVWPKVNNLTKTESLVQNVNHMASSLALVAKMPAKAVEILQNKKKIKNELGANNVEQQEKCGSFLLAPIPCCIFNYQGKKVVTEALLQQEINLDTEITSCQVVWNHCSLNASKPNVVVLVFMTSVKAQAWPRQLYLFRKAVSVQLLQPKLCIATYNNCFGFYHS